MSAVSEARSQLTRSFLQSGEKADLVSVVNTIIENSSDFSQRYYCIDCSKLLKENASITIPNIFKALQILEKYGKNLLRSDRPPQWRVVRWSNPVFQSLVDILKGSRLILKQMGYLEPIVDGASFPASVLVPDREIVAIVTSDIALLKYELVLFQKGQHPNPSAIVQCHQNSHSVISRTTIQQPESNSKSSLRLSTSSSIENLCNMCGQLSDFYCPTCKMKQCSNCDKMWHSKADRSLHKRTLLHSTSTSSVFEQPLLTMDNPIHSSNHNGVNHILEPVPVSSFRPANEQETSTMPVFSSAKPITFNFNASVTDSNTNWDDKFNLVKTLLMSNSSYSAQQKILIDFCKKVDNQIEEYYQKSRDLNHLPSVKQHFLERGEVLFQQKEKLKDFANSLNKSDSSINDDQLMRPAVNHTEVKTEELDVASCSNYSAMPGSAGIVISNDVLEQPAKERQEYSDMFFGLTNKNLLNIQPNEMSSSSSFTLNNNHYMKHNEPSSCKKLVKEVHVPISDSSPNALFPSNNTTNPINSHFNELMPLSDLNRVGPNVLNEPPPHLKLDFRKQLEIERLKIASLNIIDKIRTVESKKLLPVEIQLAVEESGKISNSNDVSVILKSETFKKLISDMRESCPTVPYSEAVNLYFLYDKDEELTKQAISERHVYNMKSILQPNLYSYKKLEDYIKNCHGNVFKTLIELQRPFMLDFNSRLKNQKTESDQKWTVKNISEVKDLEHLKTILVSVFKINDITVAEMMCTILLRNFKETDKWSDLLDVIKDYDVQDVYEASKSFPDDLELTLKYLSNKCNLCLELFPQNKVECMTTCGENGCTYCQECLAQYLKIKIREGHIRDLVCPVCKLPDIDSGDEIAVNHFTYLDIVIKKHLDVQMHSVYQKKLTDQTLMKMPNFRWCSHCENGFMYDFDQINLKMLCPDCKKATCYKCKKRWEDQHEGISCQAFLRWKQQNDENFQAEGLAAHLKENGIDCPACNFRYALAKGGCMHFKCIMCSYQFCSGCKNPFKQGQACSVSNDCQSLGLHAHHPRDCLFYLRDLEVERLQKILSDADVEFGTEAKHNHNFCQVPEQKETSDGLEDTVCGREVNEDNADLCPLHYKEYLVNLINDKHLDPAVVFTIEELETCLRRSRRCFTTRSSHQGDDEYRNLLLVFVRKLPLIHEMKTNSHNEPYRGNSQSHTFQSNDDELNNDE